MQVPEFGSSSRYNRTVMSTLMKSPRDSSVHLGGHRFMTKPVGWQMACSPSGRGVNSVTSTWLALYRARVFYNVWVSKAGARKRVRRPPPRLSERATFFYAMSIAKRIWPAILIDSKFSTKLHGIGLSPRYFEIEKKDSFWRGCLHHPAPVRIPACLPAPAAWSALWPRPEPPQNCLSET